MGEKQQAAGPELDAVLAALLGWEWRRSSDTGRRALYPPGKAPSWMTARADGSEPICRDVERDGGMVPAIRYSTDPSAAIAAAEEMRKEERIRSWDIFSGQDSPTDPEYVSAGAWYFDGSEMVRIGRTGESPAHALTLALIAALGAGEQKA